MEPPLKEDHLPDEKLQELRASLAAKGYTRGNSLQYRVVDDECRQCDQPKSQDVRYKDEETGSD